MATKVSIEDLAAFGGNPAFTEQLHVGRPNICDRECLYRRIDSILDRKWLTNNGPYVQEFENIVADYLGVKHCIATCNGTMALQIAAIAAGLEGEVIIPSFTFIATAHALKWLGMRPVFCDVDPESHNIDFRQIEKLITPQTSGVVGVHLWGRPNNIEALEAVAQRHGIQLLFDASHAFGASYQGKMVGSFGRAEIFSFHATKFFNTIEGGAVATDDDALARQIRLMNNYGFAGYDKAVSIGTNGKMNEVCAAVGLTVFEELEKLIEINRLNFEQYKLELNGIEGVNLVSYEGKEKFNFQYVVVEIDETLTHISRDQLVAIFHAENVLARRYFYPGCHKMEPYRSDTFYKGLRLPETDRLAGRVISLPSGSAVGAKDIRKICDIIRFVVNRSRKGMGFPPESGHIVKRNCPTVQTDLEKNLQDQNEYGYVS